MVPSPAGYQQAKGSRPDTGFFQASEQKAGGHAWSRAHAGRRPGGSLAPCSQVLSSRALYNPHFPGSIPRLLDPGLQSGPGEGLMLS